jgi:hypothetical protein
VERRSRCPFIGWRRKRKRRSEAVAGARWPAINGGGGGSVRRPLRGGEGPRRRKWECGSALMA